MSLGETASRPGEVGLDARPTIAASEITPSASAHDSTAHSAASSAMARFSTSRRERRPETRSHDWPPRTGQQVTHHLFLQSADQNEHFLPIAGAMVEQQALAALGLVGRCRGRIA